MTIQDILNAIIAGWNVGDLLFLVLYFLPPIMIWIKTKDPYIASFVLLVSGLVFVSVVPPAIRFIAGIGIALGFAGILYRIARGRFG